MGTTTGGRASGADDLSVRAVNPVALAHALRLAGGDRSRLRFGADGSVTVANEPRATRSPRAAGGTTGGAGGTTGATGGAAGPAGGGGTARR